MIKRVKSIRNFGIYRDYYPGVEVHDFSKFNLFYGWNGSGKSTFSRFMGILGDHDIKSEDSEVCEFEVELLNGIIITKNNLNDFKSKMFVFNQSFIQENINWDEAVKSILLISEERIEDRIKLKNLNDELILQEDNLRMSEKEYKKNLKDMNKFLSETANIVKVQFQKIETNDKYYFNYNKTKVAKFLDTNKHINHKQVLTHDEYDKITKAIKPVEKEMLYAVTLNYSIDEIHNLREQAIELLRTPYVSYSIDKLLLDNKLRNWVEEGLHLHTLNYRNNCEFCGGEILPERRELLHRHFNDEYLKFKDRLSYVGDTIKGKRFEVGNIPHTSDLYEELQSEYNRLLVELYSIIEKSNIILEKVYNKIADKIVNPFISISDIDDIEVHPFTNSFEIIKKLNDIIDIHNKKTLNYNEEILRLKKELETHLIVEALEKFKYSKKLVELNQLESKVTQYSTEINIKKSKMKELEGSLSNQFLGAQEFNKRLHAFLGRNDISLVFDDNFKGYKIIRNNLQAKNLSEGEKTAIAFVYFITKLKEHGNEISNNIIVVDDPISSFDSNNLFHAYSYLKNECQGAKQLFILTHNFNFYKLIRDWLFKKNKSGREVSIKSRFYAIETTLNNAGIRNSSIFNANESLLKYHSEYHYIFSRVYRFKDTHRLTLDEAFLVANLSRKLLESFLSFKFPKGRNDFSQLLDATGHETISKDKIYKFINKYSHNQSIEFGDDPVDNLLGESQNVVKDILELIKNQDERHYLEMIDIAERTA